MQALENIIYPYSITQFLLDNWTKTGILFSNESPNKFHHFFSWQQLNHLLNFHKLSYPEDLRFAVEGKILPACSPKDWVKHCQEGATLILNQVQEKVPVLADLTSALQQEMGHRSQVNLYCSWPSQQGFDCHYDGHEVFILQIDGKKEWFVFDETFKYPLEKDDFTDREPPKGEPYIQAVLNPGDVLYIPRGHWHYAVAVDEPSLHLTLGITCRTGVDWVNWLAEELSEREDWRQNLPLEIDGDISQIELHVQGLIDRLTTLLREEKLAHKYAIHHSTTTGCRLPEVSLPGQSGFCVFDRGLSLQFRQPKYQRVRVEYRAEDNQYKIITKDKRIELKGVPSEFMDNLFNRKTFTMGEVTEWLPGFDLEEDVIPLMWRLVKEGMLLVD